MSRTKLLMVTAPAIIALLPTAPLSAQLATASSRLALDVHSTSALTPESSAPRFEITMAPVAPVFVAQRADATDGGGSIFGRGFRTVVGVGAGALVGGWLGYF